MSAKEKDSSSDAIPPEETKAESAGLKSFVRIFHYTDNISRILYTISLGAAIAAGTALPLMNIVFGKFVTTFNRFAVGALDSASYMQEVRALTLYFVYLFIAKFVLTYIHTMSVSLAAIRTTKALRLDFLEQLLRQDMTYFDSQKSGSPSIKVTTNGNLINNSISDKLSTTVASLSTFFAAFVVAFAVQWKLTLITIAIVPVIIIITGACIAMDIPLEAKVMEAYSKAGMLAEEAFSTITTVHSFWLQSFMAQRYDEILAEAETVGMKKSPLFGFLICSSFFCTYSGYGLAFWQGVQRFHSGEISEPGDIVTVIFALVLAVGPLLIRATSLQSIAFQITEITKASSAAAELFQVIDSQSTIDPMSSTGDKPKTTDGHIQLAGVSFSYPSRPDTQVLDCMTIDVPAKKTTALVGASGSGKSTIVGLLERWYDASEGTISLDGVDVRELNVQWLRRRIRLVQQEPVLFSGSVFDNVSAGLVGTAHEDASLDHRLQLVQDACKAAFAHDFIARLPQQYFTPIGERARMLSGGQRQRIAIARAIVSDPPILLLDEATASLDPHAEKVVQQALDNVSKTRTTLVIAHKLSTVQKADNIIVLSQGTVVEQGTHRQLVERNGAYARLVRAQDLDDAEREKPSLSAGLEEEKEEMITDDYAQDQPTYTKTDADFEANGTSDDERDKLFDEGMGYSLIRCLFLLIREQSELWPFYGILGLASLLAGGTWPALAVLFSRVFNVFQLQGDAVVRQGNFWALMFFIVGIANLFIYFAIGVMCNIINQKVTRRYRLETFNNTVKQDIAFFDQESNATGAITSRLSTCATDLQELLGISSGIILNNIVCVISCTILGIAYGWKLGLVCAFGALPPLLVSGYARIRLEAKLDDDTSKRFASSAALATEHVVSIRTVSALTLEASVMRQYEDRLSIVASKSIKALTLNMFWYSLCQSMNFLAMALGFWYGGKLVSTGEYSTGQFFVVFIATVLGGENAAQIFSYSTGISKATKAANYIFWLRSRTPTIRQDDDDTCTDASGDKRGPLSVACDSVEYAYPSRPNTTVIKGINVNVPAGQFIAFVGPSGCGKSTVISLLLRFYDPVSGTIIIDSQPITNIGPRQHRKRLALVQQEPVLYSGSIRENVAMGMVDLADATEQQIDDALESANILDFVRSLPEGLGTSLGSRGTQLSGGQRQRIAIARALVRDPRLLLLDESTSALDTESEKIVQSALMKAAKNGRRTTIAVAHRLSTIKDADTIFVFHAGKIVEAGTHASLLAKRGTYFDMCQGQALDTEAVAWS